MSALKPGGSTREWRKIRAYVLTRDALPDGTNVCHWCGVTLTHHDVRLPTHAHVDHLDGKDVSGDRLDRLAPSCALHNTSRGGAYGAARRRARALNASRVW